MSLRAAHAAAAAFLALSIGCGGKTDAPTSDGSVDASLDAASETSADSGGSRCGTTTCTADQICQRTQVLGGALMLPDDAGACPMGTSNVGGQCQRDPSYACVARPTSCGATVDCSCAGDLCRAINSCPYVCRAASNGEVDCECDVP